MSESFDRRRKVQVAQGRNFRGQGSHGCGGVAAFTMEIDAETSDTGDAIGRVRDLDFSVEIQRVRCQRGENRGFDFRAVERAGFELAHVSFEAQTRRGVGNEQQVAATLLHERGKPTIKPPCGGRMRESCFAIVVKVADNSVEFRGFGHLDSSCSGRVYDGGEWESRYRKIKSLRSSRQRLGTQKARKT